MTTSPSLPDPTGDSSPLGQPRRWFWVGPICLAVVVLDQLTKIWAISALTKPIDVIWTLRLRVTRNPGAAFSTGTGIGPLIGVAAVVIVLFLLRSGRNTVNRAALVALGLVSGGAIGNLIDRAARSDSGFLGGHVVDFIDFRWWPVFNVADIGVVVGALLLALVGLKGTGAVPDKPTGDDVVQAREPSTEGAA